MLQITKEDFIKLYKELGINEFASYCGCSRSTITRWARRLNLPYKKPRLFKD